MRDLDRDILRLALPATGSGFAILVHLWIDTYWVARLDEPAAPLAALTIATFTRWIFSSVALIVGTGATALVARYLGAQRPTAAAYVGNHALRIAIAMGALCAVAGYFGAPVVYAGGQRR